ncbi:MAG: phage tail tape measure protein, partial [[Eubacterium] siraeum]|nr:phage tail tape measure protein [[Eubacterium] siraeum]
ESLEKTKEKLEKYKQQLENVRREMAANGEYSSALANKELDLKDKIGITEAAIASKNQKLRQMEQRLSEAGIDVTKMSEESKRLSEEMTALKDKEEKAAEEARKFGDSGVNAFEAVGSALAAAGISAALGKLKEEFMECVDASMEFGYTMSTVEALSGANVSEMKQLSAEAKELGANTAYTANQSAEAMTYMGMAGWNAQQMLSGMNGVINLAAASGEDLALVSDIVTDNLTAFGLKASDTAHFSDVLAAAAANSNTSVSIMGETFKGSASVAGALGYSIEDVAVAVGLMANSGVKGSIANTTLKNTFNGLLEGATLTSAAFGEVSYSTVNYDGTMKDLQTTIQDLRFYFDQMTKAEKVSNAQAIAGQRGYNGLLAILNSTDEDYAKLADTINNCTGAAQKMANTKLDNLKGDVTLLNSAADGLKMTIGELWNDELRGLAQTGTEILSGINEFVNNNPAVVKALMAVTAEVGILVAAYTAFNTAKKIKNTLDTLGTALQAKSAVSAAAHAAASTAEAAATTGAAAAQKGLNLAMLASPMGIALAAVTALTAAIVILRENCKLEKLEAQELTTATLAQKEEAEKLTAEYQKACDMYGETSDQARALKYDMDEANAVIQQQSYSVKELYAEIETLHSSTDTLISDYNALGTDQRAQSERTSVLVAKLRSLAGASEQAAGSQEQMKAIIAELNSQFPNLGLNVDNVTNKLDTMTGKINRALGASSKQADYDNALASYNDLLAQEQELLKANGKAENALWQAQKNYSSAVGSNVFTAAWAALNGQAGDAMDDLQEAGKHADTVRADLLEIQAAIADCEAIFEEYGAAVNGTSEETVTAYDAVAVAVNGVTEETQALLTAYNDAYQAAYESVSGQYALWDAAAEVSAVSADTINASLESQAKYWQDYNSNLQALAEKVGDIEGLSDIIASFADGSSDSVNAIAGMAGATDADLKKMVENWQNLQAEQEQVSKALADTRVDFDAEMENLVDDMEAAIDKMNMEDDAAKAAKETIEAYAEAIAAGKGKAVDAADQVAIATARALALADGDEIIIAPSRSTGRGVAAGEGGLNAYASGTSYAGRGLALVGERGPELVMMRGGETVYNAQETKAILGGSKDGNTVTIAPVFTINGTASDADWQEIEERMVEVIKNALRDEDIDAKRGVYA